MPSSEDAAQNTFEIAQVADSESLTTQSLVEDKVKNGRQTRYREYLTLDSGDSFEMLLEVPDDYPGEQIGVVQRKFQSTGGLDGWLHLNSDVVTRGNDLPTINTLVTNPTLGTSDVIVERGGDYDETAAGATSDVVEIQAGDRKTGGEATAGFRVGRGANLHYSLLSQANDNDIFIEVLILEPDDVDYGVAET